MTADGATLAWLLGEPRPSTAGFTHANLIFNFAAEVRRVFTPSK